MDLFWIPIARWMLHAGIGGGLILALTLLAMRRVRQPARRQRLGEAGAAAALALAILACGPAWIAIPIGEAPAPDLSLSLALVPAAHAELPALEPNTAPPDAPLDVTAGEPSPSWLESFSPLLCVLVLLYACGAVFFVVRWWLGLLALRRILRASQPADAGLLAELAAHVPHGRVPRLFISARLRVPISCGAFRPTVILPTGLAGADQLQQRALVFAHELTHLERRDAWSCVLFALAQTVYFAVPWFWRLQRQVRLCQEFVADAAAAKSRPADEYAEFLLSLLASPAAPRVATGVSGTPSDLYRRVTMLLENPMRVEKRCPYWWSAGAAGALVGLAVVGAGVGLAQAPPNQQEVLQQLERIQDMVNKLRHQLAEGAQAEARRKAIAESELTAQQLAEKQQLLLGQALVKQAKAQKALAERAAAQADQKALELLVRTRVAEVAKKPETERAELIRRIFLDLRGTPPTVEELRKYLPAPEKMIAALAAQRDKVVTVPMAPPILDVAPPVPQVRSVGGQDGQLKQVLELLEKYKAQLEKQPPASKEEVQKRLQEVIDRLNQALKSQKALFFKQGEKTVLADTQAFAFVDVGGQPPQGRLGVRIEAPSEILSEQLNLAKGQGLVVAEVFDNSVAKKAGIQVNDILLKMGNEAVSSDAEKLVKTIADMKPDTPFDIVVLRRGKEQTIVGVKLAAVPQRAMVRLAATRALTGARPQLMITLQRSGGHATVSHNEGALMITVKAAVAEGKAKLETISIVDKGQTQKYAKAEEVPAEHRDRVNQLLQLLNAVDFRLLPTSSAPNPQRLWIKIGDADEGGPRYHVQPVEGLGVEGNWYFYLQPEAK